MMAETDYCPQCGLETILPMFDGVCADCGADNQARLDQHNVQYDHWQSLTDDQRDAAQDEMTHNR